MKNSFSILAVLLVLLSACERDTNLEIPSHPPRLGVHAIWNKDSVLKVTVTRSIAVTQTPQFSYTDNPGTIGNRLKAYTVPDATVLVYQNGVLYDQLVYDAELYIYKTATGKTATSGADYRVVVSAPGFTEVESPVSTYPEGVPIKRMEVRKDITSDGYGNGEDEIVVVFDDPAGAKNHYWITIERPAITVSSNGYYSPMMVTTTDKDVFIPSGFEITNATPPISADRIILRDDNFDGKTKQVAIRLPNYVRRAAEHYGEKIYISLNSVNADLYNYMRSRLVDGNNPFSTPAQAYSNLSNGLGIFALYTADKRTL